MTIEKRNSMRIRAPQGCHAEVVAVAVMAHWHIGDDTCAGGGQRRHDGSRRAENRVADLRCGGGGNGGVAMVMDGGGSGDDGGENYVSLFDGSDETQCSCKTTW